MPPFRRKPIEISPASPPVTGAEECLAEAEAALNELLNEQARLQQSRVEAQQQREALMREAADPALIIAIDRNDYPAGLRAAQIELQLPPLQDALTEARQAVHWERWQAFRPRLVDAEAAVASSITHLFKTLERLHQTHVEAQRSGFSTSEFQRVPPGGVQGSVLVDWSLRQFLAHHTQRKVSPPIAA